MRNNVPGGDHSGLVPPAGVEKRAGGPTGRVLIEQLRASIRALEQVPVSLATPPAPGAAPSRPACSLLLPPPTTTATSPLSALQQGGLHEIKPQAYRDTPAALGFALSVIAAAALTNCRGLVLWCLTRAAGAGMGAPLWPGSLQSRPRPGALSHRRGAHRRGRRLGPGRRAEERRARRLPRASRDQDSACRPPPRPCRASLPHPVPSPLRPWSTGPGGADLSGC